VRHSELDLAIDRLEKLVLDHPDSALRPAAQARIPELRLKLLRSPEYDRGTLLKAEDELKRWLQTHPAEHELAARVGVQLGDCLRRLSDSDLSIADFYRTVHDDYAARFHAQRAIDEARQAGDEQRAQRAQAVVDALPPPDPSKPQPPQGPTP
jgi:outer membrane protein assembly factor BamD (BamD/ComL family)